MRLEFDSRANKWLLFSPFGGSIAFATKIDALRYADNMRPLHEARRTKYTTH